MSLHGDRVVEVICQFALHYTLLRDFFYNEIVPIMRLLYYEINSIMRLLLLYDVEL